jgi:GTP-binding protein
VFADKVTIYVKAGDGGNGLVSFLHEKYREFGGPDGGDGGKGGDVIIKVDDSTNTLYYYKTHHKMLAERGDGGKKRNKHGKNGDDLIVKVPRGTIIVDDATGQVLADLSDIDEAVVAKGGNGGFGNAHFISSTRQTPRVAELGEPGEERNITLELKLIADVGLVGLPNVGKSTLLSVVSAAKPKIANYEFTTLIPNLGVVEEGNYGVERGFIMADVPGLIEGASKGKGLGDEFLRHIERTKVIVHILDALHPDLAEDYRVIRKELEDYKSDKKTSLGVNLADLPEIVAINKADAIPEEELREKYDRAQKIVKSKILIISAVAHKNVPELLHEIESKLRKEDKKAKAAPKAEPYKVFTLEDVVGRDVFSVEKLRDAYVIKGQKVERFAVRTDFSNPFAVLRFKDILKKMGVDKELKRAGAQAGDKIKVGKKEFTL